MAKRSLAEATESLIAAIDAYSEQAYGSDTDSELSQDRELAIKRYLGQNIDPAPVGLSQVRDRTTFEVIEWTKPSLLRIFTSGNEVCRFDPVGPEDEELAEQESDYVNYVITQRNNWHQVCNDYAHDGLLSKVGYAHAYWDEAVVTESEFYENLTDDAFALLAQDEEIQVVAHSQRPDEEADRRNAAAMQQAMQQYQQMLMQAQVQGAQPPPPPQPPPPAFLHDVELKRSRKRGQVKLCVLAPERCLIDINTPSHTLEGCNYFEFYDWKTLGQLRSDGYDVPDDISDLADDSRFDRSEENARDLYGEGWQADRGMFADRSMRRVRVRYVWIRHDYNGDGIDELQYAILVGKTLLYRRECEEIPVASWSPIPLAHRHIGMSLADSVADIEDINTNITRQAINNLNLSNTPRIAVSDRVNMSDMLDVRVGGVIRVDGQPPQQFMPVEVPNVFPNAVQALSFFDSRRQNRTGINAYFQGTDSNALNKTASGISQLTNSAAQRVEVIARNMAAGIERLFLIAHRLILQHGHASEVIRLRNKWVTVDPAQWRKRSDVKIAVGLGTGNKDSLIAQLMTMFQMQMAVAPAGVARPENLYATMLETAKAMSLATPDRFVTDPTANPMPPQVPPEVQVKQMELQFEQQKTQAELQFDGQKTRADLEMEKWKEEQKLAFDRWKAELEAQTKLAIEQMKMGMEREKIESAEKVKGAEIESDHMMKGADIQQKQLEASGAQSALDNMMKQFGELQKAMGEVVKLVDGRRVVGVERIKDPKTGRMIAAKAKRADGSSDEITIQ